MKAILKTFTPLSLILTLAILFSSQTLSAQVDTPSETEGTTVAEVVDTHEETSDFSQLLEDSGFSQVLQAEGPYTVLAPSDDAIEASGTSMDALQENPQEVKTLVQGHLYQGELPPDQVESMLEVEVQDTDESPSNGTVHVVDQVVEESPNNN